MDGLTTFATVTGSLKAAADTLKIIIGLGGGAAFQAKAIELQSQISAALGDAVSAYEAQTTQLQRIRELEEEIGKIKAWLTEKGRYQLKNIAGGTYVHILKPAERGSEPPHWVCTNCYEKGSISVLQGVTRAMHPEWNCHSCHCKFYTGSAMPSWND